jgi:hypothetical protein
MSYPYLIQGKNIIVVIDGTSHTIKEDHLNYHKIKSAIKDNEWELLPGLVDVKTDLVKYSNGDLVIDKNTLYWKGRKLAGVMAERIIDLYKDGFSIDPFVSFIDNLNQNPSATAVNELYLFLEGCKMPITEDGCFIAYKRVNDNFNDCYTNTVLNKPAKLLTSSERDSIVAGKYTGVGKEENVTVSIVDGVTTVEMPRNKVDDIRTNYCSDGLHFCSLGYLNHFRGEKIVLLKINPADVVSIPADYNNTKGRCSKYQVVDIVEDHSRVEDVLKVSVRVFE